MLRKGFSLVRFLAVLALGGLILALLAGVWANWSRDRNGDGVADGFTLHVLDPSWWSQLRTRARPAQAAAERALFAPDGALQRARDWLASQGLRPQAAAPAPASAEVPATATTGTGTGTGTGTDRPTLHLEDDLAEALDRLAQGVASASLLSAKPAEQWTLDDLHQWRSARQELHTARRLLRSALPIYAQRVDRDPSLVAQAETALRTCEDLLLNQP